ncbi:NADH:ubiquinone reductase (Na(+)-transporting) subunit D [Candidatus Marinimicrobia bacterium]|jgi:Na+-transporting NADH:ubiquinone oxidoreductase subunit D|nr:NADH:ubiquinone reductase (Na(+)-transporting) subunit D [Candidatus Neomarinimicrobiota bacterium]MDA8753761.1 NADH:ubiquinone reductase (Na(+)-transporting) subunit D [Candidatus Neomarinimicrobiota bacterium]MDC0384198.1 NADH:ubiquinone reductase (Na(+)-transporting) subunit D [Candidatus Neomarinimicrobiota bacterium]
MALLSKKSKEAFKDPLMASNPISLQVLGICSALAVTVQVQTAVVMTLAVIAVLAASNTTISLLRNKIPGKVRIIIQLSVIATLVIVIDQILKAYMYDMSRQLSVFIALIITNCIVMGRAEAFAMQNNPKDSFLDGVGNGLGYGGILISVAVFREFLGNGSVYGVQIVPETLYSYGYENMGLMVLAPGAFVILGLIVWLHRIFAGIEAE